MSNKAKSLIEKFVLYEMYCFFEQVEEREEVTDPLFHVTYYNRLQNISKSGLKPGSFRSIGSSGYNYNAAKGVFLTETEGVSYWYDKSKDFAEHNSDNPYEDKLVPVILKIKPEAFKIDLDYDELGSKDAYYDAYIYNSTINPEYIEVWDGKNWISINDWDQVDITQAISFEGSEVYFKSENPLENFTF